MPGKKYEERKRLCVPLQCIVLPEVSHISRDDHFAAMANYDIIITPLK